MNRSAMVFAGVLLAAGCGRGATAPGSPSSRTTAVSGADPGAQPPAAAAATPATAPAAAQPAPRTADPDPAADATRQRAAREATDDPRIEEIRKKYAEIQADKGLETSELRMACAAGEGSAEVRLHRKGDTVYRAVLKDNAAGDAGSTYHFYYDDGLLIFALNDAYPFGDPAATRLLQRRYYYHQGSPILCTRKRAEGPADKVESLLNQAPSEPVDCSFAPKVQRLASLARRGAAGMAELKKLLCPEPPRQTGR
ncbi:uncharacterized protein SOCEGT47_081000 [Sorangium cellulosum]|uniref:Uncharacterized protein n=1 Tax=Sorangium cellulosum TaxID=56 RepID=A0A4P2QCW4_SORCE|nr:hypothetical protein [Sorangium cellulosum]AUX27509.1 uncharacterized protein SOCEGT47_081000 [Sorangium cellulosum]